MGSRVVVSRSGRVRSGWFHGWKAVLAVLVGLVLLAVAAFAVAYAVIRVPSPNEVAQSETSIYYYSDGKTELGRASNVDRVSVPLADMPKDLQNAVLAAEDRSFYDNPGVSIPGIARAAWAAVTGGPTQGGSTITQQYVKNYFLTHDQTLSRKARELIISIKVEQELSKQQILENYLNTIYFGRGAYGVQAAAQAYFDKDVKDLSLSESVFIASILQSPGNFEPASGPEARERLQDRMKYVVNGMVEEGALSQQRGRSVALPATVPPREKSPLSGPEGYIVAAARDELQYRVGLEESEIERGGLRVVTTIDPVAQQDMLTSVENNRPGDDAIRVGAASIKPGDGAVIAMYGGGDYQTNPWSTVTQAQLQAGSTFKVFAVAAALEKGISTRNVYDGNSPKYFGREYTGGDTWEVSNFNDADYGAVSMRTALAKSVNTAFAEINYEVGPENTRDMMVKLGIPENSPDLAANGANVFGTASVRVIDLANAYATIAANGVRAEPYFVKSMTSNDGRLDQYTASPSTSRVIDEDVAADTIDAMRRVVTEGTATRAQGIGYPSAGKTGTTDSNKAIWYGGFTPQASTAVALYMPDENGIPQPLRGIGGRRELTGSTYPLSIWTGYMRRFMEGKEQVDFPERVGIGDSQARTWSDTAGSEGGSDSGSSSSDNGNSGDSGGGEATPSEEATPEPEQSEESSSDSGQEQQSDDQGSGGDSGSSQNGDSSGQGSGEGDSGAEGGSQEGGDDSSPASGGGDSGGDSSDSSGEGGNSGGNEGSDAGAAAGNGAAAPSPSRAA